MTSKEIADNIKTLIAQAKTMEAIKLLMKFTSNNNDAVILQSSRYSYLIKDAAIGTITQEQLVVKRTKICQSLLGLANEIEAQEPPKQTLYLSDDLKEILALAEYQSRRDSEEVTGTKYFFSALTKLRPDILQPIIKELEAKDALPDDIDNDIVDMPKELSRNRRFSHCVRTSLSELKDGSSPENPIDTEDLFVDVAKFGTGSSVKRLRKQGISKEHVDEMVEAHQLKVKRRRVELGG